MECIHQSLFTVFFPLPFNRLYDAETFNLSIKMGYMSAGAEEQQQKLSANSKNIKKNS